MNLVKQLPRLEEAGINVKVISAISEELFDRQPEAYRNSVLPPEALLRCDGGVSTGTRRVWPVRNLGPLTDEYSLTSDWDNQWLTGGLEKEVIEEAHLDPDSIFTGHPALRQRPRRRGWHARRPRLTIRIDAEIGRRKNISLNGRNFAAAHPPATG